MNKKIFYILIIVALIYLIYKFKPKKMDEKEIINDSVKIKFNGTVNDFISKMKPFALQLEKEYKIPYKFIIAQTALETGWGKSTLVNDAYNFGGIKAVKGQDYVTRYTNEEVKNPENYPTRNKAKDKKLANDNTLIYLPQNFAKYPNVLEGLKSYAKVLMLPRYKKAFEHTDAIKFASQIAKGGYATSSSYLNSITKIINTYLK